MRFSPLVIICCVSLFLIVQNNVHAELYHDEKRGFSTAYPASWMADDSMTIEEGNDTLVLFLYVDEILFAKADINLLYESAPELDGYLQDYIYSLILFRDVSKSVDPHNSFEKNNSEDDLEHLNNLFEQQTDDCKILKLEFENIRCTKLELIEDDVISINGNKAYKIVYSWTEENEVCDSRADYVRGVCHYEEYDNISTTLEFENDNEIWRINSKVRVDKTDSISPQADGIINSLKFLEKTDESAVPDWVKNNAGWWKDGQLDDATFTNGIKFLIDEYIIQLSPEISSRNDIGKISLQKNSFVLKDFQGGITNVKIFGNINDFYESYRVKLEIVRPDKQTDSFRILPTKNGFEYTYELKHDFPEGEYRISGLYERGNLELKPLTFTVNDQNTSDKKIPDWVKKTVGWWSEDIISEEEFLSAIEYLVNNRIIVIDVDEPDISSEFLESTDVISSSKVLSDEYFEVFVIYASQESDCNPEERKSAAEYGYLTEYLLEKNLRGISTKVETICMQLKEIKESYYPLILAKLSVNKPDMLLFVGDVTANFESYYDYGAYGWWASIPVYTSNFSDVHTSVEMIVICECDKRYINQKDGGMWTLSHEIAHYNLYEQGYSSRVYADNVHWVEYLYRDCMENDTLETKDCMKLYETVDVFGVDYQVMDIIYLKSNWKEIQNQVSQEILINRGY